MKKLPVGRILIACVAYLLLFFLGSSSGAIHPACYAYIGALLPFLFSFIYLYTTANVLCFGAAVILNGFVLIVGLIAGEGNLALIVGLIGLAVITELVRKVNGYDTLKGVRRSFIPFAFSFFTYTAHWWTDTEGSLAAAVEEMPAGYADKMAVVIENIPALIIVLILTIPAAVIGMRIAERVMKKQTETFTKRRRDLK
jgi:hypothetical protein